MARISCLRVCKSLAKPDPTSSFPTQSPAATAVAGASGFSPSLGLSKAAKAPSDASRSSTYVSTRAHSASRVAASAASDAASLSAVTCCVSAGSSAATPAPSSSSTAA